MALKHLFWIPPLSTKRLDRPPRGITPHYSSQQHRWRYHLSHTRIQTPAKTLRTFALLATIYATTIAAASALVDLSEMISGCSPTCEVDGLYRHYFDPEAFYECCENTLDGSRAANSRWSCQGDDCCITYYFEQPQDVVKMRIAFHKGDERTRMLDVYDNGHYHSKITSSGNTLSYETSYLNTDETEDIKMCLDGDEDEWISITEVKFYAL